MSWWKPKPEPEEIALTDAAMRVRMQLQSLGSASPNEIDRAWARIIADSLRLSGYALVKLPMEDVAAMNHMAAHPGGNA